MWSIGNEIGEADGKPRSLATVKRLVQVIKAVDKTRYVTMGADKFRFGDGSGDHEKIANELDAVGLTTQKITTRTSCETSKLVDLRF